MNAKELRHLDPVTKRDAYDKIPKKNITIVLDNVNDVFNIGQIFRLADAIGAKDVILTGLSELPNNRQIRKSSMFLSDLVSWSFRPNVADAINACRTKGSLVMGVELAEGAKRLSEVDFGRYTSVVMVLGNEVSGVSRAALDLCNVCCMIPMAGANHSLNVAMSLAIAGFHVSERLS